MEKDVIPVVPDIVSLVLKRFKEKILACPNFKESEGERVYSLFEDGKTPTVEDVEKVIESDNSILIELN